MRDAFQANAKITMNPRTISVYFSCSKHFMMNIQSVGSKESLAVRLNDGICAEFCSKLWFESDWCFCNITESR